MHIVVIEWDGQTPPTTYYNRMHKLGLYVRGDKDERNPLVRRTPQFVKDNGNTPENIIFQEGCVVCTSEKLARAVAGYARTNGAKNVTVIQGGVVGGSMTVEDAKILQGLEGKLGQRGRPTGESTPWVVTCFEEAISSSVQESLYAVNCPSCRSPHMRARAGEPITALFDYDAPIFDAWVAHRFTTGQFEVPVNGGETPPPLNPNVDAELERAVLTKMRNSPRLMSEIQAIANKNAPTAARMLDAVFCGRAYVSETVRKESRLHAVLALYERGIDQSIHSIVESKDEFDLLDGCHINPERVAGMWLQYCNKEATPTA